jgi:hypothetical protein
MLGTIWINTGLALLAFVVTFGVAWVSNVWLVSLERAAIAFLIFFLAAFPIRWLMGLITQSSGSASSAEAVDGVGVVDTASPASTHPNSELAKDSDEQESFTPLTFAETERSRLTEDPTTVAEVIRRLSDE